VTWRDGLAALLLILLLIEIGAHVALLTGLFARAPRWRGFAALVVPPLAPYWGFAEGMRRRSVTWIAALVLYAIVRALAG
jgi:hypothetical protein